MTVTTSIPSTVPTPTRPGRLIGLVVAVAALTAGVTSAVTAAVLDDGSEEARALPSIADEAVPMAGAADWVNGLESLSPADLGWAYGGGAAPGVYPGTGLTPPGAYFQPDLDLPGFDQAQFLAPEELAWVSRR